MYNAIQSNSELHHYLRTHPIWYRKLGRDPEKFSEMVQEANVYYGRTFPQRIEQIQNSINLAMMMIGMMNETIGAR